MDNTNLEKNNTNLNQIEKQDFDSFFYGNNDAFLISKKTEKLASAVYLITNLFSDNEPMKWTLRKKVSELLSFINNYKNIRQSELSNFAINSKSKVSEIVSLLEVSHLGGLVSNMNFSILREEFFNLINLFKSDTNKTDVSNGVIPESFFDRTTLADNMHYSAPILKDTLSSRDTNVFKSNNRQNIILGLLKKKKELTIKDISSIIKDVSEKTIQRELMSLISMGVLVKTGERRWSKYSLNSNK